MKNQFECYYLLSEYKLIIYHSKLHMFCLIIILAFLRKTCVIVCFFSTWYNDFFQKCINITQLIKDILLSRGKENLKWLVSVSFSIKFLFLASFIYLSNHLNHHTGKKNEVSIRCINDSFFFNFIRKFNDKLIN